MVWGVNISSLEVWIAFKMDNIEDSDLNPCGSPGSRFKVEVQEGEGEEITKPLTEGNEATACNDTLLPSALPPPYSPPERGQSTSPPPPPHPVMPSISQPAPEKECQSRANRLQRSEDVESSTSSEGLRPIEPRPAIVTDMPTIHLPDGKTLSKIFWRACRNLLFVRA